MTTFYTRLAAVVGVTDPDLHLLDRSLAGDLLARRDFALRMMLHVKKLVAGWFARRGRRGLGREHDAEDVVQVTLLSLFANDARKLRAYRPNRGRTVRSWVGLIALRTLLSMIRGSRPEDDLDDDLEPPSLGLNPEEAADMNAARARIEGVLGDESLLLLHMILAGYTTQEIADAFEISEAAAARRGARLFEQIRKMFK